MAKRTQRTQRTLAVLLAIIVIGGVAGYFFYTNYVQGTITLRITDPPPFNSPYASNVEHVYINFNTIEVHAANAGNASGWHTITSSQTIDLVTTINAPQTLGSIKVSAGKYDQIRFFAPSAVVTTAGVNATLNIPGGSQTGVKVVITGGGFQISPTQTVNVQLTLEFDITSSTFTLVKADVV